jgi:5-hydroxyisourate hydrolase
MPARGVAVALCRVVRSAHGDAREQVKSVATNADGRTDEPLLSGDEIPIGVYELTFHAGDYFRANGVAVSDPAFLDEVVIRFGIADAHGHYHVPLLLSPYGYTTYRGS